MADERIPTLDAFDRLPDKFMPERLSAASLDAAYGGGGGGGTGYSDAEIDSLLANNAAADRNRANHTGTQLASTISDFAEATQDTVAAMIVAGTGITATNNDTAGTLTLDATGGGGGVDAEGVRDVMAATLVAGANVTIVEDDGANTITIAASSGGGSSDAFLLDRANHTGVQAQSTVTNLVTDLSGKAASVHTHTKSEITDFTHTHTKSAITDFAHTHAVADLPAGTTISVIYNGTAWPARPTARTDVIVQWIDYLGSSAAPSGGVSGVDLYIKDGGI